MCRFHVVSRKHCATTVFIFRDGFWASGGAVTQISGYPFNLFFAGFIFIELYFFSSEVKTAILILELVTGICFPQEQTTQEMFAQFII